jgi:hypothetical protein
LENNGRPRKSKSINWAAGGCGTKLFAGVAFHFEAPEPRMLSGLKFSRQLALNHIAQKHRNIHGSGFSLMSDGCDNLLQLPYLAMFAACADFS